MFLRLYVSIVLFLPFVACNFLVIDQKCSYCLCLSALDLPASFASATSAPLINYTETFCGVVRADGTKCYFELTDTRSRSCVSVVMGATLRESMRNSWYGNVRIHPDNDSFAVLGMHPHIAAGVMRVVLSMPANTYASIPTAKDITLSTASIEAAITKLEASLRPTVTLVERQLLAVSDNITASEKLWFARMMALQMRIDVMSAKITALERELSNPSANVTTAFTVNMLSQHVQMISHKVLNPTVSDAALYWQVVIAVIDLLILIFSLILSLPAIRKLRKWACSLFATVAYPDKSYWAAVLNFRAPIIPTHVASPVLTHENAMKSLCLQPAPGMRCDYTIGLSGLVEYENGKVYAPPVLADVFVGTLRGCKKELRTSHTALETKIGLRPMQWYREGKVWLAKNGVCSASLAGILREFSRASGICGMPHIDMGVLHEIYTPIPNNVTGIRLIIAAVTIIGPGNNVLRTIRLGNLDQALRDLRTSLYAELSDMRDNAPHLAFMDPILTATREAELIKNPKDITAMKTKPTDPVFHVTITEEKIKKLQAADKKQRKANGDDSKSVAGDTDVDTDVASDVDTEDGKTSEV